MSFNQKDVATLVTAILTSTLISTIAIYSGCHGSYNPSDSPDPLVVRTETGYKGGPNVYTIQHDGHQFVTTSQGGILHHPSCPCLKLEDAK